MNIQVVNVFFLLLSIIKYAEAVTYTVIVKTGTENKVLEGPGTDCKVSVEIYGKSRQTGVLGSTEVKLRKSAEHSNKFEKGNTDTFTVNSAEDLIYINEVKVKLYSCMFSPVWRWLLDKITIITEKGDRYDFDASKWLEKKDVYHSVKNLISASTPSVKKPTTTAVSSKIEPAKTVVITPKVRYTVTVKTGDVKLGSTSAKVYVKIFGQNKAKGADNTAAIQLTGAAPSDVFLRSSTNVFNVEDDKDLSHLTKIEVMRDGGKDDWYLEQVSVATQGGETFEFPAKTWLTKPNSFYEFKALARVVYNIIMYTGSVVKSGSRAQAYITLTGVTMASSEIHLKSPALQSNVQASTSKIYQVQIEDVGRLREITLRQDVSASSPNLNIQKVFVVAQYERIYEFIFSTWLTGAKPVRRIVSDDYPATSLKFLSYPECIQPVESKMHPTPNSAIVLSKACGALANYFKLQPDGVIQHITSGMCIQGTGKGDPRNTKHGDGVRLNYPCSVYHPGVTADHALQFKFTTGGSLMEVKSGKCISSDKGRTNLALTFSNICDTQDTKIGSIDKNNRILNKVGKSPGKAPSQPSTPSPPSPPSGSPSNVPQPPTSPPPVKTDNAPPMTKPENFGSPVYCPSTCGASSCMPSCQPLCCGSPQAPATMPAGYPTVVHCSPSCSPGQCRSECPVGCCFPNLVSWSDQQYDEYGDSNKDNDRKR